MRLSHPPSRLSPPPGASMSDLMAAGGVREPAPQGTPPAPSNSNKRKDEDRVPKRGYRACVHCRLRKAKCDLGDVNAPSEPPCTRCRREQRNCVFLPSKRRRKTGDDDLKPEIYPAHAQAQGGGMQQLNNVPNPFSAPGPLAGPSHNSGLHMRPQMPAPMDSSDHVQQRPSWTEAMGLGGFDQPKPSPYVDPPTNTTTSSFGSASASSPNNPTGTRRRSKQNEPDATRRIVVASFNNETDALEILAKAATDADGDNSAEEKEGNRPERKRVAWADNAGPRSISEFVLIRRGILDEMRLEMLVQVFFQNHHPVLPIFQTVRIPHSKAQLAALAHDDPFLLSAIVCVASRHHPSPGMKDVHEKTYALIRDVLSDYACAGWQPSIGFVEGVLILAENLPREKMSPMSSEMASPASEATQGLHGVENRRSWALTGTAIRAAYGLGLDQLALEDGDSRNADLERARGVWTWCYLYDRTLGLRTGLAFWSRGPTICFQGYSDISQTGEAAARVHFPYMMQQTQADGSPANAPSPALLDSNDSASMMQATLELTQIMTNAHDILFSTPSRTKSLVRKGEYFKFLDHFRRALDSFTVAWKDKVWRLDSTRELTWCTYHFVRLYVAAFAFQAHVQRAQERAEAERESPKPNGMASIFPRGSATSPDALFIYESIDAAQEILGICLRLGASGVLQYLPSRYLINFAYSGTFALKAAYSGAVAKTDVAKTTELVERVCAALLLASPDKDHPACRYGHMLRLLSRRLSELSDQSAVPSRFPSPELEVAPPRIDPALEAEQHHGNHLAPPQDPALFGLDQVPPGLFDVDGTWPQFNLDGFFEDFTLTDSGGFPFR